MRQNREPGLPAVNTSQLIRSVKGNDLCADCDAPSKLFTAVNQAPIPKFLGQGWDLDRLREPQNHMLLFLSRIQKTE